VVVQFVGAEIKGLGTFLETSKLYMLTFLLLKYCSGGYRAGVGRTFRETGTAIIWG
jgi:hypothetical protein